MGLLDGITKGINEIFDATINQIPTIGASKPMYNPIPAGTLEIKDINPEDAPQLGSELQKPLNNNVDEVSEVTQLPALGSTVNTPVRTVYNGTEVQVPPSNPSQPETGANAKSSPSLNPIPRRVSSNDANGTILGVTEIGIVDDTKKRKYNESEWNGILKENTARINTVLEERSFLDFYFPNQTVGTRRVAFFENPSIQEQRSARYAQQNILTRNEPVRLYVGSDARRVTLRFNYTLPHVAAFWAEVGRPPIGRFNKEILNSYKIATKLAIEKFFVGVKVEANAAGKSTFANYGSTGPRLTDSNGKGDGKSSMGYLNVPFVVGLFSNWATDAASMDTPIMAAAHYTQYVIDTIRASVVGDLTNIGPQGPPIVRLRHGTVFDEAPFIVKTFSISYPTDKGYEVKTLYPRVISFDLQLEEFRQTQGSHHGDTSEQLPGASDIIDLGLSLPPVVTQLLYGLDKGQGYNSDRATYNRQV